MRTEAKSRADTVAPELNVAYRDDFLQRSDGIGGGDSAVVIEKGERMTADIAFEPGAGDYGHGEGAGESGQTAL